MPDAGNRTEEDRARGLLLSELSNEMVRLHKRYWGRGAVEAKAYFVDDFLLVVMRGGLTVAEESMLARGHEREVRAFRQRWQDDMTDVLVPMVEERTGRAVANYQSQVMFDPDVVLEFFLFADEDGRPATTTKPTPDPLRAFAGAASDAVLREPPPAAAPQGDDPVRGRTKPEGRPGR
jgi:uncharacterized protein YbcI